MTRTRDLAFFQTLGDGYLPGYLGLEIVSIDDGRLTARMPIERHLLAPNGFLHAGGIVTLADTAAGYATMGHLPEGASGFTTMELKSNFLGTARQGAIRAEARALHLGGTTQVWDCTVTNEENGRTIALFRCTQMILYPRAK